MFCSFCCDVLVLQHLEHHNAWMLHREDLAAVFERWRLQWAFIGGWRSVLQNTERMGVRQLRIHNSIEEKGKLAILESWCHISKSNKQLRLVLRQLQTRILKTSCRALCTIILVAWTKRANASQIFSRVAIRRAFGGWEESLCSHTRLIKQHSTWPKIQRWRYVQTQIEAALRNHLQLSWQSWKMHMHAATADRHRIQKFRKRVMHCSCAAWRLSLFEKRKHQRANRSHMYFSTDPANKPKEKTACRMTYTCIPFSKKQMY